MAELDLTFWQDEDISRPRRNSCDMRSQLVSELILCDLMENEDGFLNSCKAILKSHLIALYRQEASKCPSRCGKERLRLITDEWGILRKQLRMLPRYSWLPETHQSKRARKLRSNAVSITLTRMWDELYCEILEDIVVETESSILVMKSLAPGAPSME
uniref:Uncharacterized protein n=1 Tax=Compsopogon caeruleus TaxID=31354 RepID=A0A7S1TAF2_9RHOD|mmetsp:Transcript_14394/g.29459  ORF Transcript_14394/g.29459 Transcript_14394/m.29459 type:complete len:158 (+) Transcript_14394:99-572(+)